LGDVGQVAGGAVCCATFLSEFSPVSIKMAKEQELPLDPMKISGVCGRLLCCLTYENDFYHEMKSKLPKTGIKVNTPAGPGKVVSINPLKETVNVALETGATTEFSPKDIIIEAGRQPQTQPPKEAADNKEVKEE